MILLFFTLLSILSVPAVPVEEVTQPTISYGEISSNLSDTPEIGCPANIVLNLSDKDQTLDYHTRYLQSLNTIESRSIQKSLRTDLILASDNANLDAIAKEWIPKLGAFSNDQAIEALLIRSPNDYRLYLEYPEFYTQAELQALDEAINKSIYDFQRTYFPSAYFLKNTNQVNIFLRQQRKYEILRRKRFIRQLAPILSGFLIIITLTIFRRKYSTTKLFYDTMYSTTQKERRLSL